MEVRVHKDVLKQLRENNDKDHSERLEIAARAAANGQFQVFNGEDWVMMSFLEFFHNARFPPILLMERIKGMQQQQQSQQSQQQPVFTVPQIRQPKKKSKAELELLPD